MKAIPRVVLVLATTLLPHLVAAQEALVLSGGGARGLAHPGVFDGLEELGYDPDIVVGTSMGAVAGALYAAGYGPQEIRERILAIDWNDLFTPTPLVVGAERAIRYPMISLDFHVSAFRAARGLIAQWRINRALAALLFDANARARGDFDRLARRYRAVAADLQTGTAVVISEGDLARAARASMAVPGVFAPVVWGDRVLVDGGIVNNLPTDIARSLGARRVVAVDVTLPPEEIPSLTPFAVLSRAINLILENTQRDPLPPDVLVAPELDPSLTAASFPSDPRPLFALGLEAARRDLPPSPPHVGSGQRPLPVPPDSIHELLIEAADSSLAALARRIFAGVAPGRYDPGAVMNATDRLYSTGLFEAVWPRVIEHPDTGRSTPVLHVRLDAPPRVSLSAAAGYENDRGGRVWASLERHTRVGRLPAEMAASVSQNGVDRWTALAARVYPLNRPAVAWSIGAHLRERDVRVFAEDALSDTDVFRAGGWAGVELPHILSDRVGAAAIRAEWIHEQAGREGFSMGPMLRYTSLNPGIMIVGEPLLLEAERRWGSIPYSRAALRGSHTIRLSRLQLAGVADLRLTSSGAPVDVVPALGDDHAMPGLQWGEERGRTRAVLGADAAYPVMRVFLRLRVRGGAITDEPAPWDAERWTSGAQIGLVWRNALANLEWGFGVNSRGDRRFDLSLGRLF